MIRRAPFDVGQQVAAVERVQRDRGALVRRSSCPCSVSSHARWASPTRRSRVGRGGQIHRGRPPGALCVPGRLRDQGVERSGLEDHPRRQPAFARQLGLDPLEHPAVLAFGRAERRQAGQRVDPDLAFGGLAQRLVQLAADAGQAGIERGGRQRRQQLAAVVARGSLSERAFEELGRRARAPRGAMPAARLAGAACSGPGRSGAGSAAHCRRDARRARRARAACVPRRGEGDRARRELGRRGSPSPTSGWTNASRSPAQQPGRGQRGPGRSQLRHRDARNLGDRVRRLALADHGQGRRDGPVGGHQPGQPAGHRVAESRRDLECLWVAGRRGIRRPESVPRARTAARGRLPAARCRFGRW